VTVEVVPLVVPEDDTHSLQLQLDELPDDVLDDVPEELEDSCPVVVV